MNIDIVIGANAGDEGKGTVVAGLTKKAKGKTLVVLTNGGAQRGHSILTDKKSYTFKHFGSGTSFGADSYFSQFFILNPMQFAQEYIEYIPDLRNTNIYRNESCRWSTPWDMISNQIIEEIRGNDRHGSCGMGIWETVKRYHSKEFSSISFDDFIDLPDDKKFTFLEIMRDEKFKELRMSEIPNHWKDIWYSSGLIEHFIIDCKFLYKNTIKVKGLNDISGIDNIICENGQGLMLNDTGIDDKDTTPSKTGLDIPLEILGSLKECNNKSISVHYVTRPYLTRHGGNCVNSTSRKALSSDVKVDRTNVWNEYQGEFNYGYLDIQSLGCRINNDFKKINNLWVPAKVNKVINVTHCDEMDRVSEFKKAFKDSKVEAISSAKV